MAAARKRSSGARGTTVQTGADAALSIDPARVTSVLTSFLRNESDRTGRTRLVVGLSGGLDSSVAASLAVRAQGPEQVLGVLMPYRSSSADSLRHARLVARRLEIDTEEIDITPMVDAYFASAPRASRGRRGNKMSRERMSILYDLSHARRALVVGTSNKTELLLGYGTLHGDLASALNPIGDLYKTQVRQLAAYLKVPKPIRDKPPSADLWPGQTDEQELGLAYAEADRLLYWMFDRRTPEKELLESGFPRRTIRRIHERVRRSQFKRRMPLVAKVSLRTVGIDFRYPRDWGT
jgi:NAD+ synthase